MSQHQELIEGFIEIYRGVAWGMKEVAAELATADAVQAAAVSVFIQAYGKASQFPAKTWQKPVSGAPRPPTGQSPFANANFKGVLENIQQSDQEGTIWTSGFIGGNRFYTRDKTIGDEMLRYADCDCEVTAKPGKKPNSYQLLSIK